MNPRGPLPFLLAAAALGVAALLAVRAVDERLSRGDVYPPYASLRSDPLGLKALHEALASVPGLDVERHLGPASRLDGGRGTLVLLAGVESSGLTGEDALRARLDLLLARGARVAVFLRPEARTGGRISGFNPGKDKARRPSLPLKDAKPRATTARLWDARVLRAPERPPDLPEPARVRFARRDSLASGEFPEQHRILGTGRLALGEGWEALYWLDGMPVAARRRVGAGELVLVADTFALSNEGLAEAVPGVFLAALIGDSTRLVFVDTHLGVGDPESFADLARRHGLAPAALAALAAAGLAVWRRASRLVPPPPRERVETAPTGGAGDLARLYRRALPAARLPEALLRAAEAGGGRGPPAPDRLAALRAAAAAPVRTDADLLQLYRAMGVLARRQPPRPPTTTHAA